MLPSSVSYKGKPYVDDRGERGREGGSPGNLELVDGEPTKTTRVGTTLSLEIRKKLVQFLKENLDIFTWSHEDMPSIST